MAEIKTVYLKEVNATQDGNIFTIIVLKPSYTIQKDLIGNKYVQLELSEAAIVNLLQQLNEGIEPNHRAKRKVFLQILTKKED